MQETITQSAAISKNIPSELMAHEQWVCWKYAIRDGKQTKLPVNPRNGEMASSTDPNSWSSFAHASNVANQDADLAGIGFVFTPGDEFGGVDLDDCIVDGALVPEAQAIVDAFDSYTEISPSGNGVKIFIKGTKPQWAKCKSRKIEHYKETEVYDRDRYFTVTGQHLSGTPLVINDCQGQLDDLCKRLWPDRAPTAAMPTAPALPAAADATPPPSPLPFPSTYDQMLLQRMFGSKNGAEIKKLFEGDISKYGGDDSRADLALCNHLAYWSEGDHTCIDRLFRQSKLYREKWERQDYRDATIFTAIATWKENSGASGKSASQADVPTVHLDVDEHRVAAETIGALSADPDLYQRGSVLVRVLRERIPGNLITRSDGTATIAPLPPAMLRESITKWMCLTKTNRDGNEINAHPPGWLVSAVGANGCWPGIRHLTGVSDAPVMREDGSIWQTPGYDKETGVLFDPPPPESGVVFPAISDDINIDDAHAALDLLLEVICDFRFESKEHQSAWLAGLLTPLGRFAFRGPTPLFLIDANVRGAGKGLLAQVIGRIVLGHEMPVSSYAHDVEEMRKKITALAIAGDRMILLDNLEGSFGNDALDRALTTTRWKDRILGKSEQVELPLLPVWYGTGNNVQVAADTTRRIIHIRLDVLEEHPEDRTDFKHPDLLAWVDQHRGELLCAALTILSAYCRAGRPSSGGLTPYGSFEGWSDVIRQAIVWLGLPDPCLTRTKLVEAADTTADTLTQVIDAWGKFDSWNNGVVVAEMLNRLYPAEITNQSRHEPDVSMRAAIETMVGSPPGKTPTNRQVANKLRSYRRRVIGGQYLDYDDTKRSSGRVWRLHGSREQSISDSGDSSDSFQVDRAKNSQEEAA